MTVLDEHISFTRNLIEHVFLFMLVIFQGSFWDILLIEDQLFVIEKSKFYEMLHLLFDFGIEFLIEKSIC